MLSIVEFRVALLLDGVPRKRLRHRQWSPGSPADTLVVSFPLDFPILDR